MKQNSFHTSAQTQNFFILKLLVTSRLYTETGLVQILFTLYSANSEKGLTAS